MIGRTDAFDLAGANDPAAPNSVTKPFRIVSVLLLSVVVRARRGLLEVATIVVRKEAFDANHLYGMSRHFVWLIPVTNLGVFVALGLLGWVATLAWPRRGRWLLARRLMRACAVAGGSDRLSPDLLAGLAGHDAGDRHAAVPVFETNPRLFRRFVQVSFPAAVGILLASGGVALGWRPDQADRARANGLCHRRGRPTSCWSCSTRSPRAT